MKKCIPFLVVVCIACSEPDPPSVTVEQLESPTSSLLQAISIWDEEVAWVSGHEATFIRTKDGGQSWQKFMHPTADSLQFRDVHAMNAETAILMSAGPGALSRIFTFSAPDEWEENFVMKDSLGFLDCMDFWDEKRGIAYGDAIDAYPYILLTEDGGNTWFRADTTQMPKAGVGEGGFAASGTCVTTGKGGKAWIATGAGGNCRFLLTEDYGNSWRAVPSPLIAGEAAGNTSVSFVGIKGVVTGGDLVKTNEFTENVAFTLDGGENWKLSERPKTPGAFYGSANTQLGESYFAFACGPNGIDYTSDLGQTWSNLDTLNYWAISIKDDFGYAVGTEGKILRISLQP